MAMYAIYFLLYSLINYMTDFGFSYTNEFEFLLGSLIVAIILQAADLIIFRIAYDCTGFLNKLCNYNSDDRKIAHWKFRMFFSLPVLIFSLTPFCSMLMTPIVHGSFLCVLKYYNDIMKQIESAFLILFK